MTECKNIKMYNFPILTGQSICFKDMDGEILHVKIHKSYYRSRYMLMYYTSDFMTETESYYECKGSGECWYGGCKPNNAGNRFGKENNSTVHGYDCRGEKD